MSADSISTGDDRMVRESGNGAEGNPMLSILFPCFRVGPYAGPHLDQVAGAFERLGTSFEIVAVEDGSGDASADLLQDLARTRPWLRVTVHPCNQGKGGAIMTGCRVACGRMILMNDIDLQYDVEDMVQCFQALVHGDADVVIGSRLHERSMYHITSRQLRYIFTRHVYSRLLNRMIRWFLLPGIHDTQCGLKGFTRSFVDALIDTKPTVTGFAFDVELLTIAAVRGFRIKEIPVHFRYTDIPSTVTFMKAGARVGIDLLRILGQRWRGYFGGEGRSRDSGLSGEVGVRPREALSESASGEFSTTGK